MRYPLAALTLLAAFPLAAAPAAAQGISPFTLEARTGLAFPVDDYASGVEGGYLLEVVAKISPLPFATVYGGWSFARFPADGDAGAAGLTEGVDDSGLRLGGELSVPLAGLLSGVAPYVQAGAIFNRAEIRFAGDGTNTLGAKSERTRGWEFGGGVRVTLLRRLSLLPEIRFRSYDPEFEAEPAIGIANEVSYVAGSVGVTLHF